MIALRGTALLARKSQYVRHSRTSRGLLSVVPELPWCVSGTPETVELGVVRPCVHSDPEALVGIDGEVAVARQLLQWLLLEHQGRVVVEVVEELSLEYKESPADESLRHCGLLVELDRHVVLHPHLTISARGVHAGDGADVALLTVKRQDSLDINIADAVAVSEHEGVGVDV